MNTWSRRTGSCTTKSKGRLQLSESEEATLPEIAHPPGRKLLAEIAVAPDTILGWFRKLVTRKSNGSQLWR